MRIGSAGIPSGLPVARAESQEHRRYISHLGRARVKLDRPLVLFFGAGSVPAELLAVTFPFVLQLGH
jgi:hypothetical protein